MSEPPVTVSLETIATMVHWIRHEKVMLDSDLAELYGVPTKVLNQAVKRNLERFPEDFMFQLTAEEWKLLKCQFGISRPHTTQTNAKPSETVIPEAPMRSQFVTASRRNIGAIPYAFTEQGVAMLSSVLRSERAVEVNIAIMRTFVQLRRLMDSNALLAESDGRTVIRSTTGASSCSSSSSSGEGSR